MALLSFLYLNYNQSHILFFCIFAKLEKKNRDVIRNHKPLKDLKETRKMAFVSSYPVTS